MVERPEPDIFVRILNKVEHIDEIDAQLRVIATDVREIKSVVREHDRRFDRIDQTLVEHEHRFDRIDLRLDQLETAVIDVHEDVKQHSVAIAELKAR